MTPRSQQASPIRAGKTCPANRTHGNLRDEAGKCVACATAKAAARRERASANLGARLLRDRERLAQRRELLRATPYKWQSPGGLRTLRPAQPWRDAEAMQRIYEDCRALRRAGEPVEVDHIVPLHGRNPDGATVSGLDVACNLRIIASERNNAKRCRFDTEHELPAAAAAWLAECAQRRRAGEAAVQALAARGLTPDLFPY